MTSTKLLAQSTLGRVRDTMATRKIFKKGLSCTTQICNTSFVSVLTIVLLVVTESTYHTAPELVATQSS